MPRDDNKKGRQHDIPNTDTRPGRYLPYPSGSAEPSTRIPLQTPVEDERRQVIFQRMIDGAAQVEVQVPLVPDDPYIGDYTDSPFLDHPTLSASQLPPVVDLPFDYEGEVRLDLWPGNLELLAQSVRSMSSTKIRDTLVELFPGRDTLQTETKLREMLLKASGQTELWGGEDMKQANQRMRWHDHANSRIIALKTIFPALTFDGAGSIAEAAGQYIAPRIGSGSDGTSAKDGTWLSKICRDCDDWLYQKSCDVYQEHFIRGYAWPPPDKSAMAALTMVTALSSTADLLRLKTIPDRDPHLFPDPEATVSAMLKSLEGPSEARRLGAASSFRLAALPLIHQSHLLIAPSTDGSVDVDNEDLQSVIAKTAWERKNSKTKPSDLDAWAEHVCERRYAPYKAMTEAREEQDRRQGWVM